VDHTIHYCWRLPDGDGYATILLWDAARLLESDGSRAQPTRLAVEVGWAGRGSAALFVVVTSQWRSVVFHLVRMGGVSPVMMELFRDKRVLKWGIGHATLYKVLCPHFPNISRIEDIAVDALVTDPLRIFSTRSSLSDLFFLFIGEVVPLQRHLRAKDWTAPLSLDQLRLCALNGHCCHRLAHVLS